MPELNGNQFKGFAVDRALSEQGNLTPEDRVRGYQVMSSNVYAPAFAQDYNAPAQRVRSAASAEGADEEPDDDGDE